MLARFLVYFFFAGLLAVLSLALVAACAGTTTPNDAFGAAVAWTGNVLGAVWQDRRDAGGGYEIGSRNCSEFGADEYSGAF